MGGHLKSGLHFNSDFSSIGTVAADSNFGRVCKVAWGARGLQGAPPQKKNADSCTFLLVAMHSRNVNEAGYSFDTRLHHLPKN